MGKSGEIKMRKYSVCIATYNGEKYIEEQIVSIQKQLSAGDEIIISDDGSKDNTVQIVEQMQKMDSRIKVVMGPQKGFSCNFENAMKYATGDVILFSDQDDIWEMNKIEEIEKVYAENPDCTTVLHTMSTFNSSADDTGAITVGYKTGVLKNYLMSSYWGCCMAVKREFVIQFLPFREYCVGHDQLIGLMSERYGKTVFLDEKLLKHRLHDKNTSFSLPLKKKVKFRVELLKDYLYTNRVYKNRIKGK